jgi:hypothetical protein
MAQDDLADDDTAEVIAWYATQPSVSPTPEATSRLVERLLAEPVTTPVLPATGGKWRIIVAAAFWRLRMLGPLYWLAWLTLMMVGVVSAQFYLIHLQSPLEFSLIVVLPLGLIISLAAVLGETHSIIRAVESSCPISRIEIAGGLALALLTLHIAFGALTTAVLALLDYAAFTNLLFAWLGPLVLLSACAFVLAICYGTRPSLAFAGGAWLILALLAALFPHGFAAAIMSVPATTLAIALQAAAIVIGCLIFTVVFSRSAQLERRGWYSATSV